MLRPRHWTVFVNLTTGEIRREPVNEQVEKDLIGGCGVGWKLAADHLPPRVDPLSPENLLILNPGLFVGTLTPGSPKTTVITKYPTIASDDGRFYVGSSTGGGRYFGIALNRAGCHHLVISGKAPKPVYLRIFDQEVEILSAEHLWGKGIIEVSDELVHQEGRESGVMVIGQAGENLVRSSLTIVDKTNSIGRGGLGAVFGSKNLKAIVANGTGDVEVADAEAFYNYANELRDRVYQWPKREHWIKLGLAAGWDTFKHTQYPGRWPKDEWDELYGEKTRMETVSEVIACNSCILSCRLKWRIKGGEFDGEVGFGSPFSKSATSGMLLAVKDFRKMIHIVADSNTNSGMDFYTTTRLIDFSTMMFEMGKLTLEDTSGLRLSRDYETYYKLYKMMIKREGFGDVLADGWYRLKKDFGLDPQDYWYAGITKGMDFIYDARPSNFHPLMMSFFTRVRPHHGGSHTRTNSRNKTIEEFREQVDAWGLPKDTIDRIFISEPHSGKFNVGRYTKHMEDMMRVKNSLGLCAIYSYQGLIFGTDMAILYNAVTGEKATAGDMIRRGERINNLAKLVNAREGFDRRDDKVPDLWFRPMDTPEGKIEMHDYFNSKVVTKEDVESLLDDYYEERGWDSTTGLPRLDKLEELDLGAYALA